MLWWNENLSIGIESIDQQHKSIFDKTGEILSLEETTDIATINKTFEFLINYVTTHFGDEESLMIQKGYPGFIKHREEHTYFMKELFKIVGKVINSEKIEEENIDKLKLLVIEWLVNHIHESDKTFVSFCNSLT